MCLDMGKQRLKLWPHAPSIRENRTTSGGGRLDQLLACSSIGHVDVPLRDGQPITTRLSPHDAAIATAAMGRRGRPNHLVQNQSEATTLGVSPTSGACAKARNAASSSNLGTCMETVKLRARASILIVARRP